MKRMRIAVATDDGTTVAANFAEARGFYIYEVEGDDIKVLGYRQNDFTCQAKHLHHEDYTAYHHDAILSELGDCQVFIAGKIGEHLLHDAELQSVTCHMVPNLLLLDAVKAFLHGETETASTSPHCLEE